jgi:hypothetical protein
MTTGNAAIVGRIRENDGSVRLAFPLFISAKFMSAPPDIINRMVPLFMDPLTDATRVSDDELTTLSTLKYPTETRLSAQRWVQLTGFIERARKLVPRGPWRFQAYHAIAIMLIEQDGGTAQEITDYFAKAYAFIDEQGAAADESGLTDAIGVDGALSFQHFFDNAGELALDTLTMRCSAPPGSLTPTDAMKILVEDTGNRKLTDVLRQYRVKERTAAQRFWKEVSLGKMDNGKVRLSIVQAADDKGRVRVRIKAEAYMKEDTKKKKEE